MKKITYCPSILPQHLLSLGPFPFKRLLQNSTELHPNSRQNMEPSHLFQVIETPLTWGHLPWPRSLDSGTGKGSAAVNKASKNVANRSQSRTGSEQVEWSLHNPFYCITFTAKTAKVAKAESWGMPHGKQHRVCRGLAWNNAFIFTLGPFPNAI